VFVKSENEPLKITLAYTDVAGFPGAIPALVNDLDLEVVGPDGTLYRGNQFSAGESIPNPPLADNLNNVEAVHLAQPVPGDYRVRVLSRVTTGFGCERGMWWKTRGWIRRRLTRILRW